MRRMMLLLGVAGLLTACGEASQSVEKEFNSKFHQSFVASCVSSAVKAGAAKDIATRICNCASDKVAERFSESEKLGLKDEQLRPIVQQCAQSQA